MMIYEIYDRETDEVLDTQSNREDANESAAVLRGRADRGSMDCDSENILIREVAKADARPVA